MEVINIIHRVTVDTTNDHIFGLCLIPRYATFFECSEWNGVPKAELGIELCSFDDSPLNLDLRVKIRCFDNMGDAIGEGGRVFVRGSKARRTFYKEVNVLCFPSLVTVTIKMR